MLSELISFPLWVIGSLIAVSLQYAVVLYNAFRIGIDVVLFGLTRWLRLVLRNITWPLPGKISRQYRLFQAHRNLNRVNNYSEWMEAAHEIDREEGLEAWRNDCSDEEKTCDHALLSSTSERLKTLRENHDSHGLMYFLSSILNRQFGGIENSALYNKSYVGTKRTVEEYIDQVCQSIEYLAHSNALSKSKKRTFFEHARLGYGRCALALSGGGALAMYHMGVIKALLEQKLMPRVISGTSGGSIVAAMLAMKTDEEMLNDVIKSDISQRLGVRWFDSIDTQLLRFIKSIVKQDRARMMETEAFAHTCKAYYGSVTFGEAFKRTGRIVSIPVTARYGTAQNAHAIILNYLTAPNVLLWSAVAASCALPGLMKPASLMAKNPSTKEEEPVHPSGVQFLDGTTQSDIPCEQLTILFHTNRFIVSQVNPHVTPFVRDSGPRSASSSDSMVVRMLTQYQYWLNLDIQQRTMKLAKLRLLPQFFGQEMRKVFLQRYNGHVTIVPRMSILDRFKALSHPDEDDMERYISGGQRAAWLHMSRIRTLVAIENCLTECAHKFPPAEADLGSPSKPMSFGGAHSEDGSTTTRSFHGVPPKYPNADTFEQRGREEPPTHAEETETIPTVWGDIPVSPTTRANASATLPNVRASAAHRQLSAPALDRTDGTNLYRPSPNSSIRIAFRRSGSAASLAYQEPKNEENYRLDALNEENNEERDYALAVDPLMGGGGMAADDVDIDYSYFRYPARQSTYNFPSHNSVTALSEGAGSIRRLSSHGTMTPPFQEDMPIEDTSPAPTFDSEDQSSSREARVGRSIPPLNSRDVRGHSEEFYPEGDSKHAFDQALPPSPTFSSESSTAEGNSHNSNK
eukprot:gb/GECG01012853.1/.p1 GENE.gb/GECG01012853.1/~~gb/GECG01012853.1/.p1  ORF type:complete len:857 (+),score=84.92 gb/GECG01012853.1/:1-2571(+)